MTSTNNVVVHPDFTDAEADTILIAGDGTHFHVASAHLVRTAEFFRDMFDLPVDGARPNQVTTLSLDEDCLTLEILLKLALGLSAGLARLTTLNDIDKIMLAAEKYGMKGAEEILGYQLRAPRMQQDPLRAYAIACRYGWTDLEEHYLDQVIRMPLDFALLPKMEAHHISRMVAKRQERIIRFSTAFTSVIQGSPFAEENDLRGLISCQRPSQAAVQIGPDSEVLYTTLGHMFAQPIWRNFQLAMILAYFATPSVEAALCNPNVAALVTQLQSVTCNDVECKRHIFPWPDVLKCLQRCESYCAPPTL